MIRTETTEMVCVSVCVFVRSPLSVSHLSGVARDKAKKSIRTSSAGLFVSSLVCPSLSLSHPFSALFLPHCKHMPLSNNNSCHGSKSAITSVTQSLETYRSYILDEIYSLKSALRSQMFSVAAGQTGSLRCLVFYHA